VITFRRRDLSGGPIERSLGFWVFPRDHRSGRFCLSLRTAVENATRDGMFHRPVSKNAAAHGDTTNKSTTRCRPTIKVQQPDHVCPQRSGDFPTLSMKNLHQQNAPSPAHAASAGGFFNDPTKPKFKKGADHQPQDRHATILTFGRFEGFTLRVANSLIFRPMSLSASFTPESVMLVPKTLRLQATCQTIPGGSAT